METTNPGSVLFLLTSLLSFSIASHFVVASEVGPVRTWTDNTDTHRTRASLVKRDREKVWLKLLDGRTIEVPLRRLSKDDREYVRSLPMRSTDDESMDIDAPTLTSDYDLPAHLRKLSIMDGDKLLIHGAKLRSKRDKSLAIELDVFLPSEGSAKFARNRALVIYFTEIGAAEEGVHIQTAVMIRDEITQLAAAKFFGFVNNNLRKNVRSDPLQLLSSRSKDDWQIRGALAFNAESIVAAHNSLTRFARDIKSMEVRIATGQSKNELMVGMKSFSVIDDRVPKVVIEGELPVGPAELVPPAVAICLYSKRGTLIPLSNPVWLSLDDGSVYFPTSRLP